ncbi:hypothetical protein Ddye_012006, partial [Dipteronia dyeriana]
EKMHKEKNNVSANILESSTFVKTLIVQEMSNQMYNMFHEHRYDSTILAIAIIFDPRYKMEFMMFVYERLYGAESKKLEEVKGKLFALFNEYVTSSTG